MMRNAQGRRRGRNGLTGAPRASGGAARADNTGRSDTRVRGNATQLLEKYKQMARDANQNGDRVTAEYYLQFADHYHRVLNEFRARQEENANRHRHARDHAPVTEGEDNPGRNRRMRNGAGAAEQDDQNDMSSRDHGRDHGPHDDEPRDHVRGDGARSDARDAFRDDETDAAPVQAAPPVRRRRKAPVAEDQASDGAGEDAGRPPQE